MRDTLFSKTTDLVDFTFDAQVAQVFDDMVRRSVPGYQSMIEMIRLIVKTYGQNNSNFYDLGASTGAVSLVLGQYSLHQNNRIIAVDNSADMVKKCKQNIANKIHNFEVICADITDILIENASIVVLNLTLQFIPPNQRQALINQIYRGLNAGGVLIVSEKIHFNDTQTHAHITKLHSDFKRANGYSELEIASKRQAIEKVLVTDTIQTHLARFETAEFKQSFCHLQCLNFASFLAIK